MSKDEKTTELIKSVNIRLSAGITDLLATGPGVDIEAKTMQHMDIMDMIFRKITANGVEYGSESSFMAALKAQAHFRQMIGGLNTLKKFKSGNDLPKNPWRTNY